MNRRSAWLALTGACFVLVAALIAPSGAVAAAGAGRPSSTGLDPSIVVPCPPPQPDTATAWTRSPCVARLSLAP
jgi:hypothetical protein